MSYLFIKICFKQKSLYYFQKKLKIKKKQKKHIFLWVLLGGFLGFFGWGFFGWFFLGGLFLGGFLWVFKLPTLTPGGRERRSGRRWRPGLCPPRF
jgi:hypothetical protein